jgi:uncharacterized FlaG/YvyC family protein
MMNVENQSVSAVTPTAKPPMVNEAGSGQKPRDNSAPETAPATTAEPAGRDAQSDVYESRKRAELAAKLSGADKSLVIEKDPENVGFIYKTIDRETGEVVRVWPREEVASKLAALSDVDARGMMLDARA